MQMKVGDLFALLSSMEGIDNILGVCENAQVVKDKVAALSGQQAGMLAKHLFDLRHAVQVLKRCDMPAPAK